MEYKSLLFCRFLKGVNMKKTNIKLKGKLRRYLNWPLYLTIVLILRKAMDELFATLQRASVKKEDLNTAIFCYDNRQYKACALVLLGVIDAKLIRKQNRNGYRCTGSRAAKKIREKFENERTTEAFSTMLHCVNLFSCIETGFAPAENFKAEPYTFNRNYLAHGMTRRPVRQRDCIQLFFCTV